MMNSAISKYIGAWDDSPFASNAMAWHLVEKAEFVIRDCQPALGSGFVMDGEFAIHRSATIEPGVVMKGAGIIGPNCFVASGSYLRGGVYLSGDCIIGPGSELKTSFMFSGSKIAHLNFVGDSVIGSGVNIEAGAIVANYRNELADKSIRMRIGTDVIDTGVSKFGALIGDRVRIGANAVVAPGAIIAPDAVVGRLQLLDQYPY